MTTPKTTIGIFHDYTDSHVITVEELKDLQISTVYSPKQFCDWRCNTCLSRFIFDPYSGEKIDWKRVREILSK